MAQAIQTDLGGIPQFECHGDPTSVGARWKKWKRAFELFVVGKGIDDIEQKKALLLHCAGMQVQDIYFTFPEKVAGDDETTYSVALQQLDDYFTPQLNVPYERHLFRNMSQQDESIDQFVTRLRERADNCEFTDLAEQIRDQVIEKCTSHHLRRKLLEKGKDLTLLQLQTIARALEASEQQANRMEGGENSDISFVKQSEKYKRRPDPDSSRQASTGSSTDRKCYRCDSTSHLQSSSQCPARDRECYKCHGIGHFSKCCKSKDTHAGSSDRRQPKARKGKGKEKIRLLETGDDDDVDYAFSITDHSKQASVHVDVGGVENIAMIIDSGASCNVIDETLWTKLKQNKVKCTSQKVNKQLYSYGSSTPLEVLGCFTADLAIGANHVTGEVVVIKGQGQALLGRKTAVELGVLELGIDTSVNSVQDNTDLFDKYQSCFEGLGKLKDFELDIPIDSTVKPVAQSEGDNDIRRCIDMRKGDNSHQEDDCSEECENYIRFIAQTATPKALSTRDVEEASADDDELSEIRKCIRTNQWHTLTNKRLLPVKDELCTIGFLVLRGTRILIPESLRETVLEIAHEGHPGIVCMKRRLRTKVWWTGVDKDVEKFVATCHPCQMLGKPQSPEPMKPTELPSGPWQSISADLMSLPSGDCLFVVVDYYSRYFEVDVLRTTTADKIVRSLGKMFLTHGLPLNITTDNGPQFVSSVFQDFLVNQGIEHRRVTPLWPQANGEVERQNRSLLKRVRIAQIEKKDWREEIETFLFMYRTTPHSTTGVSPSELMFKRKLRTRLPAIEEFRENLEVTDRDKEQKGKGKIYTDDKRNACENDIKAGDKVLLKRDRKDKLTPTFHAEPFRVVSKTGNSVVVKQHDGVQYKRNVTHMRKYHERPNHGVTVQANENVRVNRDIDTDGTSRENAENTIASSTSRSDVVLDDFQNTYSSVDMDSSVDVDGSVGIEMSDNSDNSQPMISRSPRPVRDRSMPLRFKDFEL